MSKGSYGPIGERVRYPAAAGSIHYGWQNGFLGVSKAAALGWARGPGKRSERRSRLKASPNAMRSFWKVAAFRLTGSIRIQSGRRALRCFQNELHHFTF